ncbi:MAG: DUF4837 family protein [Calditrichaeota bacterium]|nr:MAG: DUF4837 family protein [Calditrichota bacterium]
MKCKTIFLLLLATVALSVATGCGRKTRGFGEGTELYVIADKENWKALEPTLREVFEHVVETPQPEKVFEVFWVPPERFNEFATRKNLVIIGTLNSQGEIDQKVAGMLSAGVKQKVLSGSAFVFPKKDPWAKNQLLVVLASPTPQDLEAKLKENKDYLYGLFETKLVEETTQQMYKTLEQKDLSEKLLKNYGWTLRVQHDYFINTERKQDRFVMLRRSLADRERWLFVHWIEDGDPSVIDQDWVVKTRNKLTAKFYEGDRINPDHVESKEVEFAGRPALLVQGLWENEQKMAGGPFRTYAFYDEESGRIYLVDIAVFHPAGKKEPFLRQLDIMAHTFRTAADVEKEASRGAS